MQLMKGGASVSSQTQVGSITTKGAPSVAVTSNLIPNNLPTTGSGGYRLKGPPKDPPKDQETEEESDSEPDNGRIQVSESVAEQKLKTLVAKRAIRQKQATAQLQAGSSKQPQGDEDVPDWARVSQPDLERQLHTRRTLNGLQFTSISRPVYSHSPNSTWSPLQPSSPCASDYTTNHSTPDAVYRTFRKSASQPFVGASTQQDQSIGYEAELGKPAQFTDWIATFHWNASRRATSRQRNYPPRPTDRPSSACRWCARDRRRERQDEEGRHGSQSQLGQRIPLFRVVIAVLLHFRRIFFRFRIRY
jgi:hypothetical protein